MSQIEVERLAKDMCQQYVGNDLCTTDMECGVYVCLYIWKPYWWNQAYPNELITNPANLRCIQAWSTTGGGGEMGVSLVVYQPDHPGFTVCSKITAQVLTITIYVALAIYMVLSLPWLSSKTVQGIVSWQTLVLCSLC